MIRQMCLPPSLLLCLVSVSVVYSYNLHEVKNVLYSMELLGEPVQSTLDLRTDVDKIDDEGERHERSPPKPTAQTMRLANKLGTEYECTLPSIDDPSNNANVGSERPTNDDLRKALQPTHAGGCLSKVIGWWTYELCPGRTIKQYHMEGGKIKGEIIYLGHYSGSFDWNDHDTPPLATEADVRYHKENYTGGTPCDIGNRVGRSAEVFYFCGEVTYLARVEEPSSCQYNLAVHTPALCTLQRFGFVPNDYQAPELDIVCRPILSSNDYSAYVDHLRKTAERYEGEKERLESIEGALKLMRDRISEADPSTAPKTRADAMSLDKPSARNPGFPRLRTSTTSVQELSSTLGGAKAAAIREALELQNGDAKIHTFTFDMEMDDDEAIEEDDEATNEEDEAESNEDVGDASSTTVLKKRIQKAEKQRDDIKTRIKLLRKSVEGAADTMRANIIMQEIDRLGGDEGEEPAGMPEREDDLFDLLGRGEDEDELMSEIGDDEDEDEPVFRDWSGKPTKLDMKSIYRELERALGEDDGFLEEDGVSENVNPMLQMAQESKRKAAVLKKMEEATERLDHYSETLLHTLERELTSELRRHGVLKEVVKQQKQEGVEKSKDGKQPLQIKVIATGLGGLGEQGQQQDIMQMLGNGEAQQFSKMIANFLGVESKAANHKRRQKSVEDNYAFKWRPPHDGERHGEL